MMLNVRNIIFIYVMVVIFLPYTFAPWTDKPIPPTPGTLRTCYDWLMHHRFTNDNYENRDLAYTREIKYDHEVSYFAAAFAYVLTNDSDLFEIEKYVPSIYCRVLSLEHVTYSYITLEAAEFTCEAWVDLYLYPGNQWNTDNYVWARNRDTSMDNKISLWAALYFKYITCDAGNAYKKPGDFCRLMRQPVMLMPLPRNYPFMSIDDYEDVRQIPMFVGNVAAEYDFANIPKLPFSTIATECYEKIIGSNFTDGILTNYNLVLGGTIDKNRLNPFAKDYFTYVKRWDQRHQANINQHQLAIIRYGGSDNHIGLSNIDYLANLIDVTISDSPDNIENNAFKAPKQFCDSSDLNDIDIINYYTNLV